MIKGLNYNFCIVMIYYLFSLKRINLDKSNGNSKLWIIIYWVKCLNDFGCLMFFVFWVGFEFEMWGY